MNVWFIVCLLLLTALAVLTYLDLWPLLFTLIPTETFISH